MEGSHEPIIPKEIFMMVQEEMVWRCVSRLHKKDRDFDCPARTVTELELHAAVVQAVNEVFAKQEVLLPQVKANIERALANNNSGPVAELNEKIAVLREEILKRNRARQDLDDLGKEVIKLKEEKYALQLKDAQNEVRVNHAPLDLSVFALTKRCETEEGVSL